MYGHLKSLNGTKVSKVLKEKKKKKKAQRYCFSAIKK